MSIEHDKRLDASLEILPRSIEPQHDLWPGIHVRITQHQPPWRNWNYGLAAAALLVIGVATTWVSLYLYAPAPGKDFAEVVPHTKSTQAESGDLNVQFAAQLASDKDLPSSARIALVDNLHLIHDAILRTQAAVKKYPGDVNLQSLLFDLYQQEGRLMAEAQQAQIQSTVRTTL
ncbi:MAG TPA: hypothetical protein VNI53_00325 [Gammaproteobacteria bacterium]|nr:hypothetical protein [Gammaproteobacteria bacterium]